MSYVQFLHDYRFEATRSYVIQDVEELPEHREDEGYESDPVFDHSPDSFLPAPEGLTPLQQIEFQELRKVGGRIVGRHDAIVATPWYLTVQFFMKRAQCAPAEAKRLLKALRVLDATEEIVLAAIEEAKLDIQATIDRYETLAAAMKACDTSRDDALRHRNTDGFAHTPDVGSEDFSPEWVALLDEGVPSAAMIAHDLGLSLKRAGEIRAAIVIQDFSAAQSIVEGRSPADDEELDEIEPEAEQDDVAGFVSEGWHLMDDKDQTPDWEVNQPAQVVIYMHKAQNAESIDELKTLAQKAYQLSHWTAEQKAVFWSAWKVRRSALLSRVIRRIRRVHKAVVRIETAKKSELPDLGKRLYAFSNERPDYYPAEGWSAIWETYKRRRGLSR